MRKRRNLVILSISFPKRQGTVLCLDEIKKQGSGIKTQNRPLSSSYSNTGGSFMRKLFCVWIICCIFLCGCTSLISFDSKEISEEIFEKVVIAIKENDAETLKNLFSETAKNSSPTLDADIDRFLSTFNGQVSDYFSASARNMSRSSDYGKVSVNIKTSHTIESNGKTFYIAIQYYAIDTYTPCNLGIHSINIINSTLMPSDYVYWGDSQWAPGITFDTTDHFR